MERDDMPMPETGIVTTHFLVASDKNAMARFYADVLGGTIVFSHERSPTFVRLANTWVIVNEGGGRHRTSPGPSWSRPPTLTGSAPS